MQAPSPVESPPAPYRRKLPDGIVWLPLLWVAFMQPPRTLAPSLDASWQLMLDYAYDHGLQFGRDLLPTMGPAGFLITSAPAVQHLGIRFGWMLLGNAALAYAFWRLGLRLAGPRRATYFIFLLLLVAPFTEAMHGLAILVLGLTLLWPEVRASHLRTAGRALLLGVLALFKFTHFTLVAVILLAAAAHRWFRDGPRSAGLLAMAFGTSFVGGWLLLGQSLASLLPFLRASAEISQGYVDGMSLREGPWLFFLGLSTLLVSLAYAWCNWRDSIDRSRGHAATVMLATAWFLNWKHGFVRADGHTLTLFVTCLLPVLAFPVLVQERATPIRRRLLAAVAMLCVLGILEGYAPALTQALTTLNTRLADNFTVLAELRQPRAFATRARAEFDRFGQAYLLPRITAIVGPNSVDVLGTEQSIALLRHFNYTPRPVFQNYYAYTARLAQANEDFYASARAPQFVLQKFQTIDDRVPPLDDARVLAQVFTHYALVAEENGWLLWERQTPPRMLAPAPLRQSVVTFGQMISVPPVPAGALWVRLDIRPSLRGRLREFFYKPPQLRLQVTDATGAVQTYRLVRAMAADGFLLRPFFATQAMITGYFTGHAPAAVTALAVLLPESERKYFAPAIAVNFARLPEPPHPASAELPPPEARFRMFSLAPVRVTSPHPSGPFGLAGREVFFIHAPGEIEFDPHLAFTRLHGEVGLAPEAYTGANQTDGVEIIIEHISPGGRHTLLWRRYLDPVHQPADRGLQPFSVILPGKGRLLLRNLIGPKQDPSFDWTLWAGLRFE